MRPANFIVLLVENDPNDAALVGRAFEKASLPNTLRVVSSYDEAQRYLSGEGPFGDRTKHPLPVLVLLDLKLPGRSGFEFLEWMRSRPPLKRTPVIILASSREKDDVNRAYELGATSYMVKPVGFAELLSMVQTIGTYWLIFNRYPDLLE